LREIGQVAVPPDASPMQTVFEIQTMADAALEKAGLGSKPEQARLRVVRD
jgi:hypothetical protein